MSPETMQPTNEKKQTYGEYKKAQREASENTKKGLETYRQHKEKLRGAKEAETLGSTSMGFRGSRAEWVLAQLGKGAGYAGYKTIKGMIKLGFYPVKAGLELEEYMTGNKKFREKMENSYKKITGLWKEDRRGQRAA